MRTGLRIGFGIALGAAALALALGGCAVGHRLGEPRVEPGGRLLPARPCAMVGSNGMTTVPIYSEAGPCARVKRGERLVFVNDTGLGPRHKGATAIEIRIGGYELRIAPGQSGLIPAPVETYLGRGSHRVWVTGAPGATVLLVPPRRGAWR